MHNAPVLRSEPPPAVDDHARSSASVIPLTASRRRRAFLRRLASMSAAERRQAFESGRFSRGERALWAATYPSEVPLVNGELPWIALGLVDLD
jgi:hypothetical protein